MSYRWDEDDLKRALEAEGDIKSILLAVELMKHFIRPGDQFCSLCTWKLVYEPLCYPLVGWGRGQNLQAEDPGPSGSSWERIDLSKAFSRMASTPAPETETERWMRSSAAWNAVAFYVLNELESLDTGDHGPMCRVLAEFSEST